jgi:hypothetical protein
MVILAAIKREERKLAVRQAESTTKRCTRGCKSIGRLCGARGRRRKETRFVCCWSNGDCKQRRKRE